MELQWLYAASATGVVALLSFYLFKFWQLAAPTPPVGKRQVKAAPAVFPEPVAYIKELASALPTSVILPKDVEAFAPAMNVWFSTQNRDIIPACIVRPRNVHELSTAVKHLQREHAVRASQPGVKEGLFAVRAGGANPATGISGVNNGVVIDLSFMRHVSPAEDGASVTIGAGAYWRDVYQSLEKRGLGVIGGRASPVGVGGSTLQGGMSFFSSKHGFICSNVISYEVVLADGSIVTASANENPDLWRALKGGGNNFGVVSQFTLRSFPLPRQIWAGSFVTPGFLYKRTITAFHEHGKRGISGEPGTFDEDASTPILSTSYLPSVGITASFNHIAYAKPTTDNRWPEFWAKSPFRSLWRFQNTHKNRTLHEAVVHLGELSATENRNTYGTTTVKNDLATLFAVRQIWADAHPSVKHVKDCMFIYIMQFIMPQWAGKGDPNMLGLEGCEEPLVIISFAVNWENPEHDAAVTGAVRRCIERIEEVAAEKGTGHPYRFSNYATEWQNPLRGYGEDNMRFMRDVSDRYDPDGLFQTGCLGGFKLDAAEGKT